MSAFTVFDCFCGLGGLSLGAELAGLDVIGGVDADESAIEVFSRVFSGKHALHRDLLASNPRTVLGKVGIVRGDVDILVGGPPCQPYSINNHQRGTHDSRCGLVDRYLEFVSVLRPRWLVMENVPGFASIERGKFLKTLLRSLQARGYFSEFMILDATAFGVPQRRRRLVIIAAREKAKMPSLVKALAAHRLDEVTVGEAFGDLPEPPSKGAEYRTDASGSFQKMMRRRTSHAVQGHIAAGLGEKNLARMSHVPPGGNWRDIPRRLLPPGMKRAHLSDHTTRYGRLNAGKPSFTLLTKCDPHWGCFVHPTQNRVITVREAARLQSIPDRVEFPDNLGASYRLIGNAVPPLLAKGILEYLK